MLWKGTWRNKAEGIGRGRKLTLGYKEERNTGQVSKRTKSWSAESKLEKSEVEEKWKNVLRETIYRVKKGGKETFNQVINGHDLRTALRIPSVTDMRAASVHESSGNNDNCTWRREMARLLRWALMRNHNHKSQTIRSLRSKSSASSLILPGNRVWIKGGLMYGTEIPRPIWALGPGPTKQPHCPKPFLKLPSCKNKFWVSNPKKCSA